MGIFDDFTLSYWTWFIAAVVLLVLEMLVPGVVFLWLGIAAAVTGVIVLILADLSWQLQLVIYSVLAIISVFAGRNFIQKHPTPTSDSNLNQRGTAMIGQRYKVIEAIENGSGKVKVGDSQWLAHGPDIAEGTIVEVTSVVGAALQVKAAENRQNK